MKTTLDQIEYVLSTMTFYLYLSHKGNQQKIEITHQKALSIINSDPENKIQIGTGCVYYIFS